MTLVLFVGDRHFSSWSMRARVIMNEKGVPHLERSIALDWPMDYAGEGFEKEAEAACIAPGHILEDLPEGGVFQRSVTSRFPRVPLLVVPEQDIAVSDSIAIAEYLDEEFPELPPLLGGTARERAEIRNFSLHVHADLGHLMHGASYGLSLRTQLDLGPTPEALDQARWLGATIAWCLGRHGGPYLFGAFSLADAMVAPVAQQIRGWGLDFGQPQGSAADAYLTRLLERPSVAGHLADAREPYDTIAGRAEGTPAWIAAHYRRHESSPVINNWQTDMYHRLENPSARRAFLLAREGKSFPEIVAAVAAEYRAPKDSVSEDLKAFFDQLHPDRILTETSEFADSPL